MENKRGVNACRWSADKHMFSNNSRIIREIITYEGYLSSSRSIFNYQDVTSLDMPMVHLFEEVMGNKLYCLKSESPVFINMFSTDAWYTFCDSSDPSLWPGARFKSTKNLVKSD